MVPQASQVLAAVMVLVINRSLALASATFPVECFTAAGGHDAHLTSKRPVPTTTSAINAHWKAISMVRATSRSRRSRVWMLCEKSNGVRRDTPLECVLAMILSVVVSLAD